MSNYLPPRFLIDRSLGRYAVPEALREAGWDVVTLSQVYGEKESASVKDVEWLRLAGESGWAVLMKDKRIRYNPAEKAFLASYRVKAFSLSSGNVSGSEAAAQILAQEKRVFRACARPGPFLFIISAGAMREVVLVD